MVGEFDNYSGEALVGKLRRPMLINVGEGDLGENIGKSGALRQVLGRIGLPSEELVRFIKGEYEDSKLPYREDLASGGIIEQVLVRTTQIDGKEIEVSECIRDQISTQRSYEAELQLREEDLRYKILVGVKGEATLQFPRTINMAGKRYALSQGESLSLTKGTVVIIPAGVAWELENPQDMTNYFYISYPPYSDERDKKIQVLN